MSDKTFSHFIQEESTVCRDFLRNVCKRGPRCKFKHPADSEQQQREARLLNQSDIVFCHDFQNKECPREYCRFVHCTSQEEDAFHATGELPSHVLTDAINKGISADFPLEKDEIPLCKDYLKGECKRGGECRFRHVTIRELIISFQRRKREASSSSVDLLDSMMYKSNDYPAHIVPGPTEPKRVHREMHSFNPGMRSWEFEYENHHCTSSCNTFCNVKAMADENMMLRRRVNELKKQVTNLSATNEFLLDQNAQMRIAKQVATVSVSAPVTLTTSLPTVSTVQVAPLASLPVTLTTTIPTMSTVQMTPLAAIQQSLPMTHAEINVCPNGQTTLNQPQVANQSQVVGTVGNVATVATVASVRGVPVSISQGPTQLAAISMNPVSITQPLQQPALAAVSVTPVSLDQSLCPSTLSAVSIAPVSLNQTLTAQPNLAAMTMSPITLNQTLTPPAASLSQALAAVRGPTPQQASAQLAQQAQTLPISLSGGTHSVLSYPILTQEMQPVLQNSLTH